MNSTKKILVTGGAGYIGSHTCVELIQNGYEVMVIDNLRNSSEKSLDGVKKITGIRPEFIKGDLRDKNTLRDIFKQFQPNAVIHFAGLKAVGESTTIPLDYYDNNIGGTISLCEVMSDQGVKTLVFSSSCTVYGTPKVLPITEQEPTGGTTNPYGTSKLMIENILHDLHLSDQDWNISVLRYFNPVGAHETGIIGEDPTGIPNNLMPYITQVAVNKLKELSVFGNDYETHDGTCIRDYIHVVDLAIGHIKALVQLESNPGLITHNLGTGIGYSVLDVIRAFETESNQKIPYRFAGRRPGDLTEMYADPTLARQELGWSAQRDINQMCRDSLNWQQHHPNGFE